MAWRFSLVAALAFCLVGPAGAGAAESAAGSSVRYLPLDAQTGMSRAVIVENSPLVYTRQLLPSGRDGKIVAGTADKQSQQVLANLDAVLKAAGSDLNKLVRVNVYALSHEAAAQLRAELAKRLGPAVRPAITTVLTPLPNRKALVALDAVAVGAEKGGAVALARCESLAGDAQYADAAVLPPGGVAYLSGVPERGGITVPAVPKSLATLFATLGRLKLSAASVVQVKVFLTPASSADEVMAEVKKFFPGQLAPPVVFCEWIASAPVEIELIAQLPAGSKTTAGLQFYNPPDVRPSTGFSRVALVSAPRQVFISGLCARLTGNPAAEARDVFAQLKQILAESGSDPVHLAKATYYISDDDASKALDAERSKLLDPDRPPAASKITVYGVGQAGRTMTMDMIAVGAGP